MNLGHIEGDVYIKHIDYNQAVLWKFRQISVHQRVFDVWFKEKPFKTIRFIDDKHGKIYEVDAQKAINHSELKKVGQEPQYYFTIAILKESLIKPNI
jgi:hypothetical protein